NLDAQDWDPALLSALNLSPALLSNLADVEDAPPSPKSGELRGVPWFLGGTDGACANLGSGCVDEKTIALTIGTTGAARVLSERRPGREAAWTYLAGRDRYLCGSATNAGVSILWWIDEKLGESHKTWEKMLGSTAPGAGGLSLTPFPMGERPPLPPELT